MAEPGSTRWVAVDASVLINLIHVDRLDLLAKLAGLRFAAPAEAIAEVSMPDQARRLEQAIARTYLTRASITDPRELQTYAELRRHLGKGEAACLAMAERRGWLVACDEGGRFVKLAHEKLGPGRMLNTPGLIILAIRAGVMSIEEADQAKTILEQHRFKVGFPSFSASIRASRRPGSAGGCPSRS